VEERCSANYKLKKLTSMTGGRSCAAAMAIAMHWLGLLLSPTMPKMKIFALWLQPQVLRALSSKAYKLSGFRTKWRKGLVCHDCSPLALSVATL
jgi:hypothetical protein